MTHTDTLNIAAVGERELVIERRFAARRELVYRALSEPALLQRWMSGPPGWTMVECENDMRAGGAFHHVWNGEDGATMAMSGVYHEVRSPERIVRTERFEFGCDSQAGEQLATLELLEQAGGAATQVRIQVLYPTREARDGALASGMERGLEGSYGNLDQVLREL